MALGIAAHAVLRDISGMIFLDRRKTRAVSTDQLVDADRCVGLL
jgi:hypothetical protein